MHCVEVSAYLESSTTNFSCLTPGGLAAPKQDRASRTLSLQTWIRYAHTTKPVLLKPACDDKACQLIVKQ